MFFSFLSITVFVCVPDHIKSFATEDALEKLFDELELLDELGRLEELEQVVELEELELKELEPTSKIVLLELLELELLEQALEDGAGLKGVVRSAPQPCNNITAHRQNSVEANERDWWREKLIIRVQIFQKGLFNGSDIGNQRVLTCP